MDILKRKTPILLLLSFIVTFTFAQQLTYTQLTNGLDEPDFDEGRTDFVFDDINMDGHVDILSVGDHGSPNFNSTQHGIMVWFGDGQGNFENYMNGQFGYGGIAVGDVNNDGHKDVGYGVHHNYSGTGFGDQLNEVVLGDGTGMNWEVWDEGLSTNGEDWGMFGTAFADFNNNSFLDLVSVSFGCCAGLHVYLNQQDGSWQQSFGFLDGGSDMLVRNCDINNDGYMDFVASHQSGTAYFGDGTGDFINNDSGLPTGGSTILHGIGVAKIQASGTTAISRITQSGGVEVYAWDNNQSNWTNLSGSLPTSGVYDLSELHDMNNDGFTDVMAFGTQQFQLWLGDGTGNWTADASITTDGDPGYGKAIRAGGDLDHNGFPDLIILTTELTGGWIQFNKNILYVFKENSPADSLWIKPTFPTGGENFYPGSTRFIEWLSEVPAGSNSTVDIEISAFGPEGPWWMLAQNIPNNGRHQLIIPETGSNNCYLRATVTNGLNSATTITTEPFTIYGNPTSVVGHEVINEVSLFPNPGKDHIFLRTNKKVFLFKLFNLSGQCLLTQRNPGNEIEANKLTPGIYHYSITFVDGSNYCGKWIKIDD
jgi:hypothetical protein